MKALNDYIAEQNVMRKLFKQPLFDLNSSLSREMIADKLSSDLSPENLCCDGERSMAAVRKRARQLTSAAKQLHKLDSTVSFYEIEV